MLVLKTILNQFLFSIKIYIDMMHYIHTILVS